MADRDLRIAVVGAGMMGGDHIARLTQRVSGANVAAIVEPDAARADAAAANARDAAVHADIRDALDRDDLDAVLIATPGPFHEPVILPCLEAGVAIFCEKPLTRHGRAWRWMELPFADGLPPRPGHPARHRPPQPDLYRAYQPERRAPGHRPVGLRRGHRSHTARVSLNDVARAPCWPRGRR